ncbi:hypothetical protein CTI14_02410 [Methylobacterium radiotolerans]|nr:hypothetical protein CTI14_02410 [Methylobacterium radiotolerans]
MQLVSILLKPPISEISVLFLKLFDALQKFCLSFVRAQCILLGRQDHTLQLENFALNVDRTFNIEKRFGKIECCFKSR